MTASDSKSYKSYFIKLVDECNSSYHLYIGSKPIDAEYYDLNENIKAIFKALKFKVADRVRIFKFNNVFNKDYAEKNDYKKYF